MRLHGLDFSSAFKGKIPRAEIYQPVDWQGFIAATLLPLTVKQILRARLPVLERLQKEIMQSPHQEDWVVSHRDLTLENILWQGTKPQWLDWEWAGYINPLTECMACLFNGGIIDRKLEMPFAVAFMQAYGMTCNASECHQAFYAVMTNWLNWLGGALTRLTQEELSAAEKAHWEKQAFITLQLLDKERF